MNLCLELMLSFAKIGTFTFGGGYAMIGMIQKEIVEKKQWVEKEEFLELLTLAQTSPGPIALNTAVFVGYKTLGFRGAISALLGSILPSFIIIMTVAIFFSTIRENPGVEAVLKGIRPAVIALIFAPSINLCRGLGKVQMGVAAVSAAILCYFGFSPIWLILVGAGVGIAYMLVSHRDMAPNKKD